MLELPVVFHPRSSAHDVKRGVWCGVSIENDELPERAEVLLRALRGAGATVLQPPELGLEPVLAVHDPGFVETLRTAHERWVAAGHPVDPGAPDAIAYFFPSVAGRHGGDPFRRAATVRVELGRFAMDTMTPIGPGTWEGALASAHTAAHAADLLSTFRRTYALCRPPGHHAGRAFYGGSCYLNNAAIAAQRLRAAGCGRVAILDIDAHHGNGTQAVFWDDPTVLYASVHVDPGAGWFPHTVGYADEVDATDTNINRPVGPGTGDGGWLEALRELCAQILSFAPDAVVVSLGVDAAAEDPNSPLQVSAAGFRAAGEDIRLLDRPTVYVQEGGYVLPTLGPLTLAALGAG